MSRVRVPRHVARLVVDYFAYAARPGALARRAAHSRLLGCVARLVARLVSPLVVNYSALQRLVVDYFAYAACPSASARRAAYCRLLRLRCASGCFGTSCGSSRASFFGCFGTSSVSSHGSLSTTSPRVGSSSTTSPTPRVRVPRHVAWLVKRLVVDYFSLSRLVVDYFAYAACPGASARRAARHRLLHFEQARRRLLHLPHASGYLSTSRGSSRGSLSTTSPHAGSSSTTSPTPRVRVPRHVARLFTWLIVDYFASRRLVVNYFAYAGTSRCHGTSHGSSHGSSSTTPCAATSSYGHTGSTSATSCVASTILEATLALHQLHRAPPRRRLLVAPHRPFISNRTAVMPRTTSRNQL
jgi:hypothetical protein